MRGFIKFGLGVVCSVTMATAVIAQDAAPSAEDAAKNAVVVRQSVFNLLGWNMGPLGAMLKNKMPFDAAVAQKSATRLEQLAPMIVDAYAVDTRKFPQIKTRSKEGIWTSKADFDAKANDFVKATAALSAAAKSGDKATTLKAAGAVGKACGACHDSFRVD